MDCVKLPITEICSHLVENVLKRNGIKNRSRVICCDVFTASLSLFSESIYRKVKWGINSNNTIYRKLQLLSLVATVLYLPSKLNTIG